MIPEAAVEELADIVRQAQWGYVTPQGAVKRILEAASSHMTARAVEYLDESLTVISADPNASDYERGFDDATRGMAAKVKRLLNGEAQ